jgi:hypothetical protein
MHRICSVTLSVLLFSLLTGCVSPWKSEFHPDPALAGEAFSPRATCQVRLVEPERLDAYFEDFRARLAASDVAYEDWTDEQLLAEDAQFVRALRLPVPAEQVVMLGQSSFIAEKRSDPHAGPLGKIAAKLGADYVIASIKYLGKEERISSYPETTYSNLTMRRRIKTKRGYHYVTDTGQVSSTTWVPMQVTVDRYQHTAYFVRRLDDEGE